jgi:hypothetical protein
MGINKGLGQSPKKGIPGTTTNLSIGVTHMIAILQIIPSQFIISVRGRIMQWMMILITRIRLLKRSIHNH